MQSLGGVPEITTAPLSDKKKKSRVLRDAVPKRGVGPRIRGMQERAPTYLLFIGVGRG